MLKRVLIILALAVFSFQARAQLYLGGGISLGEFKGQGLALTLAPDLSYRVNGNFLVGASMSYRTGYDRLAITPYARWHFTSMEGAISLFLSMTAPMEFQNGYSALSARIRPGATLRVADGVYMVVNVGSFGYTEIYRNGTHSGDWFAEIDGNNISIGFCVGL